MVRPIPAIMLGLILCLLCSCATMPAISNPAGTPTLYSDPSTVGPVKGIGIESQDIVHMTDRMMRDMLANPTIARAQTPPRVIVDSEYFRNEGSSRIDKNSITDRLRIELNRAANGRMVFVGRHYADMFEKERTLKREGTVDAGTKGLTARSFGADYRLGGRITSLDSIDTTTGMASRYHQITFEMVDLETGVIVWSGMDEFKKSAQDDVVYR